MRLLPICLLAASSLQADALGDLRAALQKLQGRELVKARAEVSTASTNGEGKKQKSKQSRGSVLLEEGPAGLRLGWTAEQMEAARAEARRRIADPEAPTPALDAMRALGAEDAAEMLGAASVLLLKVSRVKVLEERPEAYGGKPARLLHLQLEPAMSADQREMMKKYEQRLKVWLDADGTPLGAEENLEFKGSKFLISFGGTSRETTVFRRLGARLLAERTTRENAGSGMGMTSSGKTVVTLTVL
jgi:hypothetical protein